MGLLMLALTVAVNTPRFRALAVWQARELGRRSRAAHLQAVEKAAAANNPVPVACGNSLFLELTPGSIRMAKI